MGTRENKDVEAEAPSGREGSKEIQTDIEQTLSRMDRTLDDLGTRLRPGHLINDVVGYIRGQAVTREERETPLDEPAEEDDAEVYQGQIDWRRALGPVALVIAGMAWMVFEEERAKRRAQKAASEEREPKRIEGERPGGTPGEPVKAHFGSEDESLRDEGAAAAAARRRRR